MWGLIALALLVAYPLSVGPAARLHVNGLMSSSLLVALYRPLVLADEMVAPLTGVMNWYINLWQPRGQKLRLVDRNIVRES